MVQRHENGNLSWMQNGAVQTVSKEQPEQYSPALETEDMQISAVQENKDAKDQYMTELETAQENVDASRPIPGIPVKPVYVTVSDPYRDGQVVTPGVRSIAEPWPPPGLPDLKKKTIYPSGGGKIEEEIKIEPPAPENA